MREMFSATVIHSMSPRSWCRNAIGRLRSPWVTSRPAVTHDAGIERMDPGEDLDQRGFAGAVLAQERDDLTRAHFDACVTEGARAAKPLRHAAHRQKILFRPLGKGHWKVEILLECPAGDGRGQCVSVRN